ncbi:MAG: hypothetical protein AB9897_02990 [Anaerolineaceae bacterium]
MPNLTDQNGKKIVLGKLLGKGGEGAVYLINGDPNSVAKIYFPERTGYYEPRLSLMISNPPEDQTRKMSPPHISIAWPERNLFDGGKFTGYTMPLIQKAPDIFKIYALTMRRTEFPNFNWYHLHHVALNLAVAVNAYHAAGYVIGDLNAKNVKVHKTAMVTMIDTDSVQVRTAAGQVLRCPVGTPEFTAPELQGLRLDQYDRDNYHDAFALSVMIFLLLMEGYHPYTGAPVSPSISVNGPVYQYCIKNGIFPYQKNGQFIPPKNAPDFHCLHPDVQALFVRCFAGSFGKNRTNRPLPIEWYRTLYKAESELVKCNKGHMYFSGYGKCPWCKRDAFLTSVVIPVQKPAKPMPPLTPTQQPRPVRQTPIYSPPPATPRRVPMPVHKSNSGIKAALLLGGIATMGIIGYVLATTTPKPNPNVNVPYTNPAQASNSGAAAAAPGVTSTTFTSTASCPDAVQLLMSIGDVVTVTTGTSLRGHSEPSLTNESVIARYPYGERLSIIDGPACATSSSSAAYWMWLVQDSSGNSSWVAEGDTSMYFLQK